MVNRRGLRSDRPARKKQSAMRRLVPFVALVLTLGTVSAPLMGIGTAAAFGNPSATTSAATSVSGTGATLNGTVNAERRNDNGHLLLQHLELAGQLLRSHLGERQPPYDQ